MLTGKTPSVLKALRFHPSKARLRGLKSVRLRGMVNVNPPVREDFFTSVVEERQRIRAGTKDHPGDSACPACRTAQFLKILANSGSYGIYAEMVRHELGSNHTTDVKVFGKDRTPFDCKTTSPRTQGSTASLP